MFLILKRRAIKKYIDVFLVSVGASGAVYGLLFFCIIDNTLRIFTIKNLQDKIIQFLIMLLVIPYFMMSQFLVVEFSGRIDHAAHAGGALMGILVAVFLCDMPDFITSRVQNGGRRIQLIALIGIVGYFCISLIVFYLLKPISII
jgi:membrane associated rhomboid family serine protease